MWVQQVREMAHNVIIQPALRKLWHNNFKHADEVTWGEWWGAFPKLLDPEVDMGFFQQPCRKEAFKVCGVVNSP